MPFDRRLVQAGYPRLGLVLAKVTSLAVAAAAVAVYATAWMQPYWRPQQLVLLAASLFLGALIYGGIGIMLAAILRTELAGMFLLIMISFIDLGLQNPISNTTAASPFLRVLPDYGAMESAITSVGQRLVPWDYLALGLLWAVGTAATGIMAFVLRTRSRRTDSIIDAASTAACSPGLDQRRLRQSLDGHDLVQQDVERDDSVVKRPSPSTSTSAKGFLTGWACEGRSGGNGSVL